MSIIKVNCPSCKSPLQIPEPKLRETQGRVVCRECQHIFRLVKKNKNQTAKQQRAQTPPRPVFEEVGSTGGAGAEPVWPTDGWPEGAREAAAPQPKRKKAPQRPQYRVPKAQTKPPRDFADVGQQPFAFNLLDPQSANMQIPQVSVNPPADGSTASPPALRPNNGSEQQQNNITIHTGSLVFTLVGDGQNSSTTLAAPDNAAAPPQMPVQMPVQSAATELNWVVATMVAFLVFILQLVYINLMFL